LAYCTDAFDGPISTDQRGESRPKGTACDIGSVEIDPAKMTVSAKTGPWSHALNPGFDYDSTYHSAGAPVAIPVTPGATVTVTYAGGGVVAGVGYPVVDANGIVGNVTNNADSGGFGRFPAVHMNPAIDVYSMALVGTFANDGIIVGTPFAIGNGPAALTAPAGANQLLLGINDAYFGDNSGALIVTISIESADATRPLVSAELSANPAPLGNPVVLTAVASDVDRGNSNILSVQYSLDSGTTWHTFAGTYGSPAVIVSTNLTLARGVYGVCVRAADAGQNMSDPSCTDVLAVYDPAGGFVTGGGWIQSPQGAYTPDPSAVGKASFGFVSKYQNGAATPAGDTQFQFNAGSFRFRSTAYDWLVIAGARAQYKGVGTVNGSG
jgi:hypothetical protein